MMIVALCLIALNTSLYCSDRPNIKSAITYKPSGRFGDSMLALYKAIWLSRKYDVELLCRDFKYFNALVLYAQCKQSGHVHTPAREKEFEKIVTVHDETKHWLVKNKQNLYVINYYSHLVGWHDEKVFPEKHDAGFINYLKTVIRPIKRLALLPLPKNIITVAVHVRKGGGYDLPLLSEQDTTLDVKSADSYIDTSFLLKFPPDTFYIEQIEKLYAMFNKQPLYVYLFTDDRDPQRLADKFSLALNNSAITIDCRKEGNAHNINVLEDFFSMTRFDCLIRGDSSYSKAAQLLAEYKTVIFPEHGFWQGRSLVIDKVTIMREGH